MKIYIPALQEDCPAHLALKQEGVEHEIECVPRYDPYYYSILLARLWRRGIGFVILEHDVVPWPGALNELAYCPNEWCTFPFPKFGEMLEGGLGCVKFSDSLVTRFPKLYENWFNTHWKLVDGRMLSSIAGVLHGPQPCIHNPPVAHVRSNA